MEVQILSLLSNFHGMLAPDWAVRGYRAAGARLGLKQNNHMTEQNILMHLIKFSINLKEKRTKKKRCLIFQRARAKKGESGNKHAKF